MFQSITEYESIINYNKLNNKKHLYLSKFKAAHRLQRIFWFGKAWRRKLSSAIVP